MKRVVIGIMSAVVLTVFAGAAAAQDANAKGEKVYADQKCSLCHSIAGKGNPKGVLDDVGSKLTPAQIREWIVNPAKMAQDAKADRKPPMPPKFKDLPKEDLDALVAYLSSLKKK